MPWCEGCSKFWNPNSVGAEGRCPTCGRQLPPPASVGVADPGAERPAEGGPVDDDEAGEDFKAPWHFKLLVAAVVAYLGWRAFQGLEWVLGKL